MDNYINIRGNKLYYRSFGSGPCIVFLHGIPTNSTLWDGVIPYFEKEYSVYAFDLLGFGRSSKPDSSMLNIKYQSQILVDAFKSLSLNNIILAGHDIGGGIAQIIAVSNPRLLKAMVLMDSACYDSWPIELLRVERKVGMLFEHLPPDVIEELFLRYIQQGMYNKGLSDSVALKYCDFLKTRQGMDHFLDAVGSFDSIYTMELVPVLDTIRTPALILWGRHDNYIRLSYGYRLSEDIDKSMLKIIDNAGHFLPEDQPARVAEEILDFLGNLYKWQ